MILNDSNFKQEVEDYAGVVLVDFFATWCGLCQMMLPIVEEMIEENKDENVKIGKLNIEESPAVAAKYEIMSIPAFLVFKAGKVVSEKFSYSDKQELEQLILKNK